MLPNKGRLTAKDVAAMLGMAMPTLKRLVDNKDFPTPITLSPRNLYWYRETVVAWLIERGVHVQDIDGYTPSPEVLKARQLLADLEREETQQHRVATAGGNDRSQPDHSARNRARADARRSFDVEPGNRRANRQGARQSHP